MRRLIAKLGPYGLSTLITFATGIVSVPLIISLAGSSQWTGLAITQSVAAIGAVVVGFGWTATGPTMIASMPSPERPAAYARSLQVRSLLFVVTAPVAAWVAILITSLDAAAATMGVIAYLLQALGGMWYFIGESRPYRVVLLDTLPRAAAILLALAALWATRSMTVYTAVLLVGTLTAAVLAAVVILRGAGTHLIGWRAAATELRKQRHGVIATASGVIYSNSPLIIASVLIPGSIEPFTLAFKLYHYAAAAFQPVVQLVQGWIPSSGPAEVGHRIRLTQRYAAVGAAILFLGMGGLLPFVAALMSGGEISVGFDLAVPFGICLAAVFLNQVTGLACLTAVGRSDVLAMSSALGAIVGIGLLCGLAVVAGQVGLAWALALTECTVTTVQMVALFRTLSPNRADTSRTAP